MNSIKIIFFVTIKGYKCLMLTFVEYGFHACFHVVCKIVSGLTWRRHGSSYPSHHPRLPGQSFAIEHRVHEKKSKFRSFLGAAGVEDAKRFVAFVLEASGRLGPDAVAFLEYLRALCRFPILRFRVLTTTISAKHNTQMALRWVRYLRRPI